MTDDLSRLSENAFNKHRQLFDAAECRGDCSKETAVLKVSF